MSVRNTLIKTVMITTATLLLTACSSLGLGKKDEELAFVEEPAEIIYNNAFAEVERGDWANARRLFQEVERQHPFSKWARRGILMSGYSS